ncbi:MAG: metallophosphoesterase [Labilithrix sp.]|nr:metallophosphoesterase [Labilithrix sp.]
MRIVGWVTTALLLFACGVDSGVEESEPPFESEASELTSTSYAPVADAWVDSSRPNQNFGADAVLRADTAPAQYQSYLRFDVPAFAGTVTRAVLRLWVVDETLDAPALYNTSTGWSEMGITWANRPATTTKVADIGRVLTNKWVEYDVTARVKAKGSYAFALVTSSADGVQFGSRTSANAPKLVLQVTPPIPSADAGTSNDAGVPTKITCPTDFATEVFRDDFSGSAVDTAKWQIVDQGTGGGPFTQLTMMRRENVRVEGGNLRIASQRHCEDPRANRSSPEHPALCAGTNYYSGGWLKTLGNYAPGKGLMVFRARMPAPVRGFFPALWARNTEGGNLYTEFDLIETGWDNPKGVPANPNTFKVTTHFGTGAAFHAQPATVGPFANLVTAFHVWELEWNAEASPAIGRYYYRDAPGAARTLVREVTHASPGFAGKVTATDFAEGLRRGFRPYIDFAVAPESEWNVGPDSAATYDPEDLLVDSVIVCKP